MFHSAIVRPPAENFADGLTTAGLGAPVYTLALGQHQAYCQALRQCGLQLTMLEPDPQYPDSCFVEDVAVLTRQTAILTNPGADSRRGEVSLIRGALTQRFERMRQITEPGRLEGGDICEAGQHFFIGISRRTNPEGARQLAGFLAEDGYTSSFVDIRQVSSLLHLKSGIAYLGDNHLVLIDDLVDRPEFAGYNVLRVDPAENYAANCVRINDFVILPAGFPKMLKSLKDLGYQPLALEMSEYQKMDGGLSCLSLRM